jgi:nucleoside-diphosphate-sugar epimerase
MEEMFAAYYEGRRAIVLGGAGFIGSSLARRLVALGGRVAVVDGFVPGGGANLRNLAGLDSLDLVRCDISEVEAWAGLMEPDSVLFHCAARNTHRYCNLDPEGDARINYLPQYRLLEMFRSFGHPFRLVYAGTRTVYSASAVGPIDETTPTEPQDVYSLHALAAENLFRYGSRRDRFDLRVLRLTNTYGPGQRLAGEELGLVGEMLLAALLDRDYVVFGDGSAGRDIDHVDDVVDGMLAAGATDGLSGTVVNLGGAYVRTRELVNAVVAATGWDGVLYATDRRSVGSPSMDVSRAAALLGWSPRTDLATGIRSTIDYYRSNLEHYIDTGDGRTE